MSHLAGPEEDALGDSAILQRTRIRAHDEGHLINLYLKLDPALGTEIRKTRPAVTAPARAADT